MSDNPETQGSAGGNALSKDLAFDKIIFSWAITAISLAGILFALLIPIFIIYYYKPQDFSRDPPMLIITMITGALGGFFSVTTRIYHLKVLSEGVSLNELNTIEQKHLVVYLLIPTATGAIAAAILYTVFAGGLIQGDLFPKFRCSLPAPNAPCISFRETVDHWVPNEARDFCKVIIWGFVAGFIERFVPDMLGTIRSSHS